MTRRAWLVARVLGLGASASALQAQAAPDAVRGQQIYARCLACHALAYDRVGPRHCGLFGRLAGSVPDFGYSRAMKESRVIWDDPSLDRFLAAPTQAIPGTTMTYDGVPDRREREDLIAYLRQVNETSACRTGGLPPR